jgi:hypothetical protein
MYENQNTQKLDTFMYDLDTNSDIEFDSEDSSTVEYFIRLINQKYDNNKITDEKCTPPEKHGLSNSFCIIPAYYQKNGNLTHINFFEIIKDDIRNLRPLNKYQLEYIKQMNSEDKTALIEIFNQSLKVVNDLLDVEVDVNIKHFPKV